MHRELSGTFNYLTNIKRIKTSNGDLDSCNVVIKVKSKDNSKIYFTIRFTTMFLFDSSYTQCNRTRSYITGINGGMQILDWDYGDLIVADFNFDNREDFAFKKEEFNASGPIYDYYIQKSDSTFKREKFLSDSLPCFPHYFNRNEKTLTCMCFSGYSYISKEVFKYYSESEKWIRLTKKEIDITK
jgi:hypothetical protein